MISDWVMTLKAEEGLDKQSVVRGLVSIFRHSHKFVTVISLSHTVLFITTFLESHDGVHRLNEERTVCLSVLLQLLP